MKKKALKSNILRRLRKRFALRPIHLGEEGQSTTEYILILAVVVMLALKFKNTFSGRLEKIIGKLGEQIDEATEDTINN